MNTLRTLDRRDVVAAYVAYDARKKGEPSPDTSTWDWTSADKIDKSLRASGYKCGIPAGYLAWHDVELTVDDLRDCAVVTRISEELNSGARDLGTLEAEGVLTEWEPDRETPWFAGVLLGQPFQRDEPFLLRPSVRSERPAKWYLEDGSGRATAVIANASRFGTDSVVAYGFLGVIPDAASTFMNREPFNELLKRAEHQP